MSLINIQSSGVLPVPAVPVCGECAQAIRLVGIEAHPRLALTDLRTYYCDRCDKNEVLNFPLWNPELPVPEALP